MSEILSYGRTCPPKYRLNTTWNAILTIAGRDVTRYLRTPMRLIFTFILPLILVGGLAGPLQSNFGQAVHYSLIAFSATGLLGMSLFQNTMSGLVSLIKDRTSDFSQELFIAPISRYAIVFGKILGESVVALIQGIVLVILGITIFNVPVSPFSLLLVLPVLLVICLFGGSLGVLLTSLFSDQRTANIIMPFIVTPQILLSGVFLPISNLPWYLDLLAKITPMRYAVDLVRGTFYLGRPEYSQVVLLSPLLNLLIIGVLFVLFLSLGTTFFVRSERNR